MHILATVRQEHRVLPTFSRPFVCLLVVWHARLVLKRIKQLHAQKTWDKEVDKSHRDLTLIAMSDGHAFCRSREEAILNAKLDKETTANINMTCWETWCWLNDAL